MDSPKVKPNGEHNSNSAARELLDDWIKKIEGSWIDFRAYSAQRRRVLDNPLIIASPGFPTKDDIPPLKFALQGMVLVAALATILGWGERLVFPHHADSSSPGATDFDVGVGGIETSLHLALALPGRPEPDKNEIDDVADSIAGAQLDDLQAELDKQQRILQGIPTEESSLADARVIVLTKLYDARQQLVQSQHITEPRVFQGNVYDAHKGFIEDAMGNLAYDPSSGKVTNIDSVAQQLATAKELKGATTIELQSMVGEYQDDAAGLRGSAEVTLAKTEIEVLKRAIELKKSHGSKNERLQRHIHESSELLSPVIPAIVLVVSAYLFRAFIKVGRERPTRSADRADSAYLYVFTSGFFWLNATYVVGSTVLGMLWNVDRLNWKWLLAVSVFALIAYISWGLHTLLRTSQELAFFFGMRPDRRTPKFCRGDRKVLWNLVLANAMSAVPVAMLATGITFAYAYIAVSHNW
jgi:hypothetical protein